MSYYESHWFTPTYEGIDHPITSRMDAKRGLCRAKGLIRDADRGNRLMFFNSAQKQCRVPIMDIRFTVAGTKINQQR